MNFTVFLSEAKNYFDCDHRVNSDESGKNHFHTAVFLISQKKRG